MKSPFLLRLQMSILLGRNTLDQQCALLWKSVIAFWHRMLRHCNPASLKEVLIKGTMALLYFCFSQCNTAAVWSLPAEGKCKVSPAITTFYKIQNKPKAVFWSRAGNSIIVPEMNKSCLFSQCSEGIASNHCSYLYNYIGVKRRDTVYISLADIYVVFKKTFMIMK